MEPSGLPPELVEFFGPFTPLVFVFWKIVGEPLLFFWICVRLIFDPELKLSPINLTGPICQALGQGLAVGLLISLAIFGIVALIVILSVVVCLMDRGRSRRRTGIRDRWA
jgi:hypothetical protein